MAWQPSQVTTLDGRTCLSNSETWLRYCEALTVIKTHAHVGGQYRVMIEKMRGKEGLKALEAEMDRIEPAYCLSLPDKMARRAHLERVGATRGLSARNSLEQRIRELWEARKAAEVTA